MRIISLKEEKKGQEEHGKDRFGGTTVLSKSQSSPFSYAGNKGAIWLGLPLRREERGKVGDPIDCHRLNTRPGARKRGGRVERS